MALVAPEGEFKQCSTKGLDALHYLNALFKGLDPITGSGHNISVSDYMGSEHEVKRRKRGSPQPFPNLKKAAAAVRGDHTEEEEGEEMDIEAMVAETPSSGKEPIESPYGYNCYKVDIGDQRYHTKQDPSSKSWAPVSPQCYCGIQCKMKLIFLTIEGNGILAMPIGSALNVTYSVRIKGQSGNIIETFIFMFYTHVSV